MSELEQTLSDEELLERSANLRNKLIQTKDYFLDDSIGVMPYSAQEKNNGESENTFSQYDAEVIKSCLTYIHNNKDYYEMVSVKDFDETKHLDKQDIQIGRIITESKSVLEEHAYFMESQKPGFDDGFKNDKRTHFTRPVMEGFDGTSAFYLMLATNITNQGLREKLQETYKD